MSRMCKKKAALILKKDSNKIIYKLVITTKLKEITINTVLHRIITGIDF